MWAPVKLNNGTTILTASAGSWGPLGNHKRVNHGGSLPGFRAQFARFVDDKLSIIVLTNADNAQPQVITRGIAALYFPDLATTVKAAGTR